jgi:hypothetical protein
MVDVSEVVQQRIAVLLHVSIMHMACTIRLPVPCPLC